MAARIELGVVELFVDDEREQLCLGESIREPSLEEKFGHVSHIFSKELAGERMLQWIRK